MTSLGRPPPKYEPCFADVGQRVHASWEYVGDGRVGRVEYRAPSEFYLDWLEAVRFALFARALTGLAANGVAAENWSKNEQRFGREPSVVIADAAKAIADAATALWSAQYEEKP